MNEKNFKDKKIGVFLGGISSEREISLKSGEAVFGALKEIGQNVIKVDITSDSPSDIKKHIESNNLDLVFIALHGEFGEDGKLQKILEDLNISFTGSGSIASHFAMDKVESKKMFKNAGLDVPSYFIMDRVSDESLERAKAIGFPLVVKPCNGGSSIGLSLVEDSAQLNQAVSLAKKYDGSIVIEQFIKGRELTVGILDDKPLPPIEIVTDEPFFNYQAKYKSNTTNYIVPAKLDLKVTKQVMDSGLIAHKALSCRNFSRVDMILSEKDSKVYILELNAIPGLTQRSLLPKAAKSIGIDFPELCLKIIGSVTP